VGKVLDLRGELSRLPPRHWAAYLTAHSGLPGPRGNIELGQAFADLADERQIDDAIGSGDEYLTFCGVVGLGRLLADSPREDVEARLRHHAADPRWRVREAVAMALQRLGDADRERLSRLVLAWAHDADPLVQRAAAAGICEPRLLTDPGTAAVAVDVCRSATEALVARPADSRRDPGVRALRKGLGYCWSVAIAADPAPGLAQFRAWEGSTDPDVAWVVRENHKKSRLARLL
jgi:hypothetical protein